VARSALASSLTWNQTLRYVGSPILPSQVVSAALRRCDSLPHPASAMTTHHPVMTVPRILRSR
jgi:hypothetical protein